MLRKIIKGIIAGFLLQFPVAVHSMEATIEEWREYVDPEVRVSGSFFVGVQSKLPTYATSPKISFLASPDYSGSEQNICIRGTSIDGVFKIQGQVNIPKIDENTIFDVPFASDYPDLLNEYGASDFALRVSAGSCREYHAPYLIGVWRGMDGPIGSEVNILINAAQADRIMYLSEIGDSKIKNGENVCARISNQVTISFNFICSIPIDFLSIESPKQLEFQYLRRGQLGRKEVIDVLIDR